MYDEEFDPGWETLTRDEALRRAYALGVAASLGEPAGEELDRVREEMSSTRDRGLVDLAYNEGRTHALERTGDAEDGDEQEVWADLVEDEAAVDPTDLSDPDIPAPVGLASLLAPVRKPLDRIRLPEFLRR